MHQDQKRLPLVMRTAVLVALTAVLLVGVGCAQGVRHDPALTAKARSAIMSTCGGDMVKDVTADSSGFVLVGLSVKDKDAAVARAVAEVTAGIILKGVPDATRVGVRDSASTWIDTYSRD